MNWFGNFIPTLSRVKKKSVFPNSFYKADLTLTAKFNEDKKENYTLISHININARLLKRILGVKLKCNQTAGGREGEEREREREKRDREKDKVEFVQAMDGCFNILKNQFLEYITLKVKRREAIC